MFKNWLKIPVWEKMSENPRGDFLLTLYIYGLPTGLKRLTVINVIQSIHQPLFPTSKGVNTSTMIDQLVLTLFNEVNRHLSLITTWISDCLRTGKPSGHVASHLGWLSLLSSVGRLNEYQLSGWIIIINGGGGKLAWSKSRRPLALFLQSLREPGELSQCSKYDDSTI